MMYLYDQLIVTICSTVADVRPDIVVADAACRCRGNRRRAVGQEVRRSRQRGESLTRAVLTLALPRIGSK